MREKLMKKWWLIVFIFTLVENANTDIPFTKQPDAISYAICEQDALLQWEYDEANAAKIVNWLQLSPSNDVLEKIASYENGAFKVESSSTYQPAVDGRIELLGNAGLKIKSVKPTDTILMQALVTYFNTDQSQSLTELQIIVLPKTGRLLLQNSITVSKGDASTTLTCVFEGQPAPSVTWMKDSSKLISGVGNHNVTDVVTSVSNDCGSQVITSNLIISNPDEADIGKYMCIANQTTTQSRYLNQSTLLVVQYSPNENSSSFKVSASEVIAGVQVIFTCQGSGVPNPTYQISFKGVVISSGGGDGSSLSTTYKVGAHGDGVYECTITNSVGSFSRNISLIVNVVPEFWMSPPTIYEVESGAEANISCGIFADPFHEDNVTWSKSGGVATFTETKSVSFTNDTLTYVVNYLVIAATLLTDYGTYTCTGVNKVGSISASTTLRVKSAPTITSMNLGSTPVTKSENSELNLQCVASGYPRPVLVWQIDGLVIDLYEKQDQPSETDGQFTVRQSGKFVVNKTHAGIIGCYASNGVSPNATSTTKLVISYVPVIDLNVNFNRTLFDLDGMSSFQASLNETIMLSCEVTSQPLVEIIWTKNGVDMTNTLSGSITSTVNNTEFETYKVETLELTSVQTSNNNDVYECQASNSEGSSKKSVKMLVLYGYWVKKPLNVTYGASGLPTFLDWQFYYTQEFQLIIWKDGSDFDSNSFGSLNAAGVPSLQSNYDYNNDTKSGFYIKNTQSENEGWYGISITFQNSPEVLQDVVYVSVIRNPHSTVIQPVNPSVTQYSDITLTCTSVGKPSPQLKWFQGNDLSTELNNASDWYIVTTVLSSGADFQSISSLTLVNVSFQLAVQYTCAAVGVLANETRVSNIFLLYPPLNTTLSSNENPILRGRMLTLTCNSTANPMNVYYTFYHDGVAVQNTTSNELFIPNVLNWHAGTYTCLPVNMIGNGTIASFSLSVQVPPYIYETNDPHYVEEASNAQLICKAYGNPKPEIYWQKLSGPSGSTNNLSPTTVDEFWNSTLFVVNSTGDISTVTKQDQGVYECMANSTLGEHSMNITLAVQVGAKITNTSLDGVSRNFTSGNSSSEWCIAEGLPKPVITWTLNNQPITRHTITTTELSNTIDLIVVASYISIEGMDLNDNGVLMCTAVNNIASASNSTPYSVKYPPKLSSHPKSVEGADISGKLQLSCVANSKEIATISWEQNGIILSSASSNVDITVTVNENLDQVTSTLVIQPVTQSTLGNYKCTAANSLGSASDTTSVNIYSAAKITSFPTSSLSVQENTKNYEIVCVATGTPLPEVTWYFANSPINFATSTFVKGETDNTSHVVSTLTIVDVTKSQYGDYKCEAKNLNSLQSVKTDTETTTLVVQHDPQFITGFPLQTYTVPNYDDVTITCRAHASPQANVYIFLPDGVSQDQRFSFNTEVTTEAQTVVTETNLTITNVTKYDYGVYRCFANTSYSSTSANAMLNVLYPPSGNTTTPLIVHENSNLFLEKTISSNTLATPRFYFEGSVLNVNGITTSSVNTGGARYGGSNLTVTIRSSSAQRSMSGKYEIITCNSLGCRSDVWNLIVYYSPQLMSSSGDKTQLVSTQVVFQCVFYANPTKTPVMVTWQKGTATLVNFNDINIAETSVKDSDVKYTLTSTLTLSNIAISSGGEYKCIAKNVVGSNSSSMTLVVHYAPIFVNDLSTTVNRLEEGASLPLSVRVTASPSANFTWYRNAVNTLTSTDTIAGTNEQQSQVTATANFASSGVYSVVSCNIYGCVTSKNATLIVEFKPMITSLTDQTVVENNTKSLQCKISAEPQVQSVTWTFNDTTVLSNNGRITIQPLSHTDNVYTKETISTITISDAQRDINAGKYTCNAVNTKGETNADGKLIVQYPVRLVSDVYNITVVEGNMLQLAMSVNSNPLANFKWYHKGEPVDKIYDFTYTLSQKPVYDFYKNEKLTLDGSLVTPARGGWYEVEVENLIGSSLRRSAYVNVIWRPKFIIRPAATIANLGDTAQLTCRVEAYPPPKISWEKSPSQTISSSQYTENIVGSNGEGTIVESVLTLTNLQEKDFADFTCKATNEAGESTSTALMNVQFPPRLLVASANVEIEKGNTLNLSCSNVANPTATQEWKKQDTKLSFDGIHYSAVATECTVVEGTYSCTPQNSVNTGSTVQYIVTCIAPPSVTVAASCQTSETMTTCQCNGTGYPPPQIYWQKYGSSSILSTGDSVTVSKNESSDGTYICKINNTAGSIITAASLAVFGPLTGEWSEWGSCLPTCSSNASKVRSRACNENICYDALEEKLACQSTCNADAIPTVKGDEDDPLIALFILAPLLLVLFVFCAVACAQHNALLSSPLSVVPVYQPPYRLQQNDRIPMNGHVVRDPPTLQETIEVNVPFADEENGNFPNDENIASPQTTGTLTSDDVSAVSDDDEDQIQYVNTATMFPEG